MLLQMKEKDTGNAGRLAPRPTDFQPRSGIEQDLSALQL